VVSDRWYNGFENGTRPPSRYDALVSRLGHLLRLTPAEHLNLHLLATGHEPAPSDPDNAVDGLAVRPVLEQLLALLGPGLPAIACDIAWNVIAWNQAITDHLAGDATVRPGQSNVITWLFTDDAERIIADLGHAREAEIGNVLLAMARYPDDQRLQRLASQLQEIPGGAPESRPNRPLCSYPLGVVPPEPPSSLGRRLSWHQDAKIARARAAATPAVARAAVAPCAARSALTRPRQ